MVYKIKVTDPVSNQILYFTTNWYVIENGLIWFFEQKNNKKESWNQNLLINIEEREPYPIAQILKQEGIQLIVRCPHCKQKHFHGSGGEENNNTSDFGLRIPHCNDIGREKANIPHSAELCQYRLVRQ